MPSGDLRRRLRGHAHALSPVVQIGKEGLTPAVIRQVTGALHDHELIKVKLGGETPADRFAMAERLAEQPGVNVVQIVGRVIVLYKRHPQQPQYEKKAGVEAPPAPEAKPRPQGKPREEEKPRDQGRGRDERKGRGQGKPRDERRPRDGRRPRDEGKPRDQRRPRDEGKPRDQRRPRDEGKPRVERRPAGGERKPPRREGRGGGAGRRQGR
jgi:RNA-binding protein